MVNISEKDIARFMSKVEKHPEDGCWKWKAWCDKDGYGGFWFEDKTIRAHRFSWMLHNNETITKDRLICHSCDVTNCVNPKHLFIGCQQENMNDMIKKGRATCGEKSYLSKLTEDDVKEIFNKIKNGCSRKEVAKEYNVTPENISSIKLGRSWKHLNLDKSIV